MRLPSFTSLLLFLTFSVISCDNEARKRAKEERLNKDNFFKHSETATSLDSFQNELADGQTDFLRSFSNDAISWQKWDRSILEKAESAQSPIMALVGSSLGGNSRKLGRSLSEDPELRELVTKQSLCTVIDTYANPEMGLLSYHLTSELKRAAAFPTLVWLSHEGAPLAWIPVGKTSGRDLTIIVTNAVAMVEDIWTDFSEYAVENSRKDNESRQRRFDANTDEPENKVERNEIFRRSTRQLSSLYSFGDRDLDYIGGLIPTNSLELLAIGSQSDLLTNQVRENCRKAALEVSFALVQEGIKDHLDGSYFFARRTTDWSLPSFSKNIVSLANTAHMLMRVGSILGNQALIDEGLSVLRVAEDDWLAQSLSSRSPSVEPDEPGKFLWNLQTLKKVLSEEEIPLAIKAFSLSKDGNVPPEVDPLGNYFELNTLRRRIPNEKLAEQFGQSVEDLNASINSISKKLLKHRTETTVYNTESSLCLGDLALILRAQVARAMLSNDSSKLELAFALADRLQRDYVDPEKGLARLPTSQGFLTARCGDYASASNAFLLLYQASLDEKWLTLSLKILDEAIAKLNTEGGLLSEIPEDERVIPLRQHNRAMIFGSSSLGVLDLSLNRAWAITGDAKYLELLKLQENNISPMATRSPVNHTDFLASCALGTHPLVAIVKGNPDSQAGQEILRVLNSQKHLPFLSIRAARESDANLIEPSSNQGASVTLIRNDQVLGSATTESALTPILRQIISGN